MEKPKIDQAIPSWDDEIEDLAFGVLKGLAIGAFLIAGLLLLGRWLLG